MFRESEESKEEGGIIVFRETFNMRVLKWCNPSENPWCACAETPENSCSQGNMKYIVCEDKDKDCYLKWLTKLRKEAEHTWKCTCEKGACLCTTKELENFLKFPKKMIACSSPYCKPPRTWTGVRPVDCTFYRPTRSSLSVREGHIWGLSMHRVLYV